MSGLFRFRDYDLPVNLVNKTGGGPDTFEKISDWHILQVQRHIGIKETDNVVEIGCGIGRDAIPLTRILTGGSYLGTDVIGPSINWCVENITPRHPNFTFIHHDIHDTLHNPNGTLNALDVRVPSDDESVDLILLHSVFTHMMEDEIIHYMREFLRILKPAGRVWASCFLVDNEVLRVIQSSDHPNWQKWKLNFPHRHSENCYINSKEQPRSAVAYEESAFMKMIDHGGLVLDRILWGEWSGQRQAPQSGQDIVILKAQQKADPLRLT